MKNIITETIKDVWNSMLGRVILIGLAVGWVPFTILSLVHNALTA